MMEISLNDFKDFTEEFDSQSNFILLELLGTGSFGKVYKAIYKKENSLVAVKIIKKNKEYNTKRIKKELEIFKQLRHKNIVEFNNVLETNLNLYIIMEYVKWGTLRKFIDEHKAEGI